MGTDIIHVFLILSLSSKAERALYDQNCSFIRHFLINKTARFCVCLVLTVKISVFEAISATVVYMYFRSIFKKKHPILFLVLFCEQYCLVNLHVVNMCLLFCFFY